MAQVINDIGQMQGLCLRLRIEGKRIAVVPTMGYLHDGHVSLIREAKARADVVMVTVFVNPTQFGPGEDFTRYPRDLDRDVRIARGGGADYVFAPTVDAMYPTGFAAFVDVDRIANVLEGKSRPGHFRGVATVVAKLLNITQPHVALFGQKDAQQVVIVRRMVADLDFPVQLIICATVREPDGLALSSRNSYLTADQRAQAPVLFRALTLAGRLVEHGERRSSRIKGEMTELIKHEASCEIDYVSVADASTLEEQEECHGTLLVSLAARFGSTRLIDNIVIDVNGHHA
jgi:pantoate--beta-alanine ligase